MGLTRFLLTSPESFSSDRLARVYFSGPDGVPIPCRASVHGNLLEIDRDVSDSGNYHIPWAVAGYGELVLSTASLRERETPYLLALELARGTLSQLRNQAAEWLEIGLMLPPGFNDSLRAVTDVFAKAATSQDVPAESEQFADETIRLTMPLGDKLAAAFIEQATSVRKRQTGSLPTWLGAALDQSMLDNVHGRKFLATFNAVSIALNWRHVEPTEGSYQWKVYDQQLEWCRNHMLQVAGGPLMRLDASGCPDWLCLWEGDFDNLVTLVTDYVETAVERYRGRIELWNCAARFATGDGLSLSEEDNLQLAVRAIEVVRRLDPETPAMLTFDQPWAEFMQQAHRELSPLHTADALLRSDLGLAAIGLELNIGFQPHGSGPRGILALNRLLDWWSTFGLPIFVFLSVPSASGPDDKAQAKIATVGQTEADDWTPERQSEYAGGMVALLLAKPAVRGVFWNQWRDDEPHVFPHAGLWNARDQEKPLLGQLKRLRKSLLS